MSTGRSETSDEPPRLYQLRERVIFFEHDLTMNLPQSLNPGRCLRFRDVILDPVAVPPLLRVDLRRTARGRIKLVFLALGVLKKKTAPFFRFPISHREFRGC
jgi:hypothetical protein